MAGQVATGTQAVPSHDVFSASCLLKMMCTCHALYKQSLWVCYGMKLDMLASLIILNTNTCPLPTSEIKIGTVATMQAESDCSQWKGNRTTGPLPLGICIEDMYSFGCVNLNHVGCELSSEKNLSILMP